MLLSCYICTLLAGIKCITNISFFIVCLPAVQQNQSCNCLNAYWYNYLLLFIYVRNKEEKGKHNFFYCTTTSRWDWAYIHNTTLQWYHNFYTYCFVKVIVSLITIKLYRCKIAIFIHNLLRRIEWPLQLNKNKLKKVKSISSSAELHGHEVV